MNRRWVVLTGRGGALIAGALLLNATTALRGNSLRPPTPDDVLRLERIEDVQFSPDERTIAYVHQRSLSSSRVFPSLLLHGNDRGDVWIARPDGSTSTNLTSGAASDAGFWSPRWSPDGERLAMLSTKDGNVHLWVWERATNRLSKLSDRAVSFDRQPGFIWIDNHRIAAILLPAGERPVTMILLQLAGLRAMDAWQKAWIRGERTASVMESGATPIPSGRAEETVTILDAAGRDQPRFFGTSPTIRDLRLSPDRKHLAYLTHVAMWRPRGTDPLPYDGGFECLALAITDLDGRSVPLGPLPRPCVKVYTFRWSPDGRQVAFLAQHAGQRESVVIRKALDGDAVSVDLPSLLAAPATEWADRHNLLVQARRSTGTGAGPARREDWWLIPPHGTARNFTESLPASPATLFAYGEPGVVTAIAGPDVWQRRVDGDTWTKLPMPDGLTVTGQAWPRSYEEPRPDVTSVLFAVREQERRALVRFDVKAGAFTRLPAPPSEQASVAAYAPRHETAIFTANERHGTFLVAVRKEQNHPMATANEFLRTVAEGELKAIEYRSLDGRLLKAWLLLPVGYRTGTRYPLIGWVYAGDVMGDRPPSSARLNNTSWLNLQLLAARGYAVIVPSMPLSPDPRNSGQGSDPYLELANGVLPAFDKAIDLGVADPERLALIGHSFGGYSVYGLATQTTRFKAGIALAAAADLSSKYGTFEPWSRHGELYFPWLDTPYLAEHGQTRMGSAPWRDSGRYIRNSPLTYVERVQTPLLIVHGDMDSVPIEQAEQVFTALYRQGKRARFVRYWGEGHHIVSPANIKDLWAQIYAWLEECLNVPSDSTASRQTRPPA